MKLVCQLLQQVKPGSSNYTLHSPHSLVCVTTDSSLIVTYFHKADFGSGVAVNQNAQTVIHTCAHKNLNSFSTFESFVNIICPSSDL